MPETKMLKAALAFAARGWPVFPCNTKTKQPLVEHGVKDATTDADQVCAWWSKYPTAMIGVATGETIGAFVLDLDVGTDEKTGEVFELPDLVAAVEREIGEPLPPTLTVTTPRGGEHRYFALPPAAPGGEPNPMPGNRAGVVRRVDVRGNGGYVILPPSARADGRVYAWVNKSRAEGATEQTFLIAPAPPALLDLIRRRGRWSRGGSISERALAATPSPGGLSRPPAPPSQGAAAAEAVRKFAISALASETAAVAGATTGGRNDRLNVAAFSLGQLVAAGALTESVVRASLEDAAERCGLAQDDGIVSVRKTIDSGLRDGAAKPRDLREVERKAEERAARYGRPHQAAALRPDAAADSQRKLASPRTPLGRDEADQPSQDEVTEDEPHDIDRAIVECAALDQSDTSNAQRLMAYFGRDVLVIAQSGVAGGDFLTWTGAHWDLDDGYAGAAKLSQKVGDLILREADVIEATPRERQAIETGEEARRELPEYLAGIPSDRKTWDKAQRTRVCELESVIEAGDEARDDLNGRRVSRRKFAVSSKNVGKLEGMLKCAVPHLRRPPEAFNTDPHLVVTRTHTLRFVREVDLDCPDPDVTRWCARVAARKGHRRADLITAMVPVDYDPAAEPVKWRAFIERMLPDEAKRRTVQQYSGLGLLNTPIQRFMFHHGVGANGKSVFLEVLTRVLGDSFAISLPTESIIGSGQGNAGGARADIARLFGKRMVRVAELPPGQPLQIEIVKKLTGGERIPVRTLYKGYFEFTPTAKPHMSTNGFPAIDDPSNGIWRRMLSVEWDVVVPEAEQRDFEEMVRDLLTERAAIFNWLCDGALDYLANGLVVADSIKSDTQEYRDEMDTVGQFVRDCVEHAEGQTVTARAMYNAYQAWCAANAKRPVFETKFGRVMRTKWKRDDKARVRLYLDARLHDVPEAEAPAATAPGDELVPV